MSEVIDLVTPPKPGRASAEITFFRGEGNKPGPA
jgi:hypothetical protein